MSEVREDQKTYHEKRTKKPKWLKVVGGVLLTVIIFGLGFSLGNGRIRVHNFSAEQNNLPANLDTKTVQQVYDSLRQNYDGKLDVTKLLDGLKHGLAQASGDPYTDYFSTKEAKDFNDQLSGTFQGVGAELGKDVNNNLIVVSPIAGFPAEKAGLKPKDLIVGVDNTSTAGMSVDQAVGKIRGPKGTTVSLKIIRGTTPLTIKITRDDIKIPSVTSKTLPGNIGYIQVSEFSDDTVDLATKAANDFKQAGVKGMVLDLRGDPGGELNAAVSLSSLWLKNGQTVLTERRDGKIIQTYNAEGNSPLNGIKTVVLIDDGSASASEITAGALRDNNAATLIGVKSYGKGSVQQIVNFGDGSELKVTIARWFTPNGKNIDKQGITPDQTVKRSQDDIKAGKDPQLDAATVYITK
jgi:carboxyl-terminal processing protease